ncbi:acetamidase/formamidase family protein (plasmid) [Deinococcus taeanensis]|uniref:acetamidase/formamidase family protein n=1 Tax=Deinococcus taeanensis TaxID=2737050 RepID=UPI001CDC39B9|nr:acetamidase/formamidase family protein [Deinococcus taeanensis]UBV44684.1 acetamidase/formamidase family protein [Deinococcus taeanensis]
MSTLTVPRDQLIYAMDRANPPVLRAPSGSTLVFQTRDCFEDQIQDAQAQFTALDWNRINPATGPVHIEGAEPGDALAIEIIDIRVGSQAVMVTGPDLGVEGDRLTEPAVRVYPIDGDHVTVSGVRLPLRPMIGVIGTAPADEPVPNGTPGDHGGNMDTTVIRAGSTLYLPVNVDGALLALGDLHAGMGDGEVSVCGLEVPGEVTLRVTVLKQCRWPLPMVVTDEHLYTIASALTLDEAATRATKHMSAIVQTEAQLSRADAIGLLSAAGNLQISQVVDPLKTCRFELSLDVLRQLNVALPGVPA